MMDHICSYAECSLVVYRFVKWIDGVPDYACLCHTHYVLMDSFMKRHKYDLMLTVNQDEYEVIQVMRL